MINILSCKIKNRILLGTYYVFLFNFCLLYHLCKVRYLYIFNLIDNNYLASNLWNCFSIFFLWFLFTWILLLIFLWFLLLMKVNILFVLLFIRHFLIEHFLCIVYQTQLINKHSLFIMANLDIIIFPCVYKIFLYDLLLATFLCNFVKRQIK